MPFVPVPKDLSKVKTKLALGLTKRQLICFSSAAGVGVPTYLFTRLHIGNDGAALLMIALMLPFCFIAMFERDGQPAEKIARNVIRARLLWPVTRPYKTENLYEYLRREGKRIGREKGTGAAKAASRRRGAAQAGSGR